MCNGNTNQEADMSVEGNKAEPTRGSNGQRYTHYCEEESVLSGCPTSSHFLDAVSAALERQAEQIAELRKALSELAGNLAQLTADRTALSQVQEQFRQLAEQSHERQVLWPLFQTLIGIIDRQSEQITRYKRALVLAQDKGEVKTALFLQRLIEARHADRLEIHNVLATYGVEPFTNPDEGFDFNRQTCKRRDSTDDPGHQSRISARLAPGYRRQDRIVRPEQVAVYVPNSSRKEGL
jgi:molecular chaperone GrpE (heat shock protein)